MMRASFSFGTTFFGMPIPLPVITLFMDARAYTARCLLPPWQTEELMKRAITCAIVLLAFACMQKQSDGTYRATPAATDAAKKAKDDVAKTGDQIKKTGDDIGKSDAVQKMKNGSVELGRGVKEGLGQAAQKAGASLQKAGKKAEDDVKKTEKKSTH
jgi:hypothetical protein